MSEMITSAVVQEAVSGAVSFVFSSRGEKLSQKDLMERLEMVHIKLDLALERTKMMPVIIMPLLRQRKKLKDVFKECENLFGKARGRHQVVPSLHKKIMHAVMPSFIVPNQDVLSSSIVGRFEWFAKEADKFVRDMESGCSLSHYRFFNPLIRHLLEGKDIFYRMVQGSQIYYFSIWTALVEEYGRVATLCFQFKDGKTPLKRFALFLALRLYESTNIVGVTAKCLQSLGPQFKSLAKVATGELTQLPTQDVSYSDSIHPARWDEVAAVTTYWCPDPFCCIENVINKPCANNIISSELTGRFPQEVMTVGFRRHFLAYECCSRSSTDEAGINTIKAWPPIEMIVRFAPHISRKLQDGGSLHQKEEGIRTEAINYFIHQPELTKYRKSWSSAHGCAIFDVSKPITKTRRASKRRR